MAGQRDDNSKKKQISAMNNHPDQDQAVGYKILGLDGLAWARQKNFTVVVDPRGKVLEDLEIDHSALGWKRFRQRSSFTTGQRTRLH
jgi:hypothetical protein